MKFKKRDLLVVAQYCKTFSLVVWKYSLITLKWSILRYEWLENWIWLILRVMSGTPSLTRREMRDLIYRCSRSRDKERINLLSKVIVGYSKKFPRDQDFDPIGEVITYLLEMSEGMKLTARQVAPGVSELITVAIRYSDGRHQYSLADLADARHFFYDTNMTAEAQIIRFKLNGIRSYV